MQSGWESDQKYVSQENDKQNNLNILKKWKQNFASESHGNHVALVGNADLKNWEMVGKLLISKVWKP